MKRYDKIAVIPPPERLSNHSLHNMTILKNLKNQDFHSLSKMSSRPPEMFLLHFCAFQDEFENFSEGIFDFFLVAVGRSSESPWVEVKIPDWICFGASISDWLQRLNFDQNRDFHLLSKMGSRPPEMFLLHFCAFQDEFENFSEGIFDIFPVTVGRSSESPWVEVKIPPGFLDLRLASETEF